MAFARGRLSPLHEIMAANDWKTPGGGNLQISSLRGRRLKGKGKGVLGARSARGGREGGKRLPGNHCFRHPAY